MRHGLRFILYLILSFRFFALNNPVEAEEVLLHTGGEFEQISLEQGEAEGNFSHSVLPASYPAAPGRIIFAVSKDRPARVRALLTLDDSLLIIPLYPNEEGAFVGTFPTPERKLTYQFQLQSNDGSTRLSKRYAVMTECEGNSRGTTAATEERFPDQHRLIEEALLLEREIELESVVSTILTTYLREEAE